MCMHANLQIHLFFFPTVENMLCGCCKNSTEVIRLNNCYVSAPCMLRRGKHTLLCPLPPRYKGKLYSGAPHWPLTSFSGHLPSLAWAIWHQSHAYGAAQSALALQNFYSGLRVPAHCTGVDWQVVNFNKEEPKHVYSALKILPVCPFLFFIYSSQYTLKREINAASALMNW